MSPHELPLVLIAILAVHQFGDVAQAGDPEDRPLPRISLAGTLVLPDKAQGPDGEELSITGLSGVTWLGDDRYVSIMDNSDRMLLFRLEVAADGDPREGFDLEIVVLDHVLDYEDVAVCPPRFAERIAKRQRARGEPEPSQCLLVCEETTPAIRAVDMGSGKLLGLVPIPKIFETRRPNRGLEALAADPDGMHAWTANEEALPADGPLATESSGTVVRLARIGLSDAAAAAAVESPTIQFAYAVDPPHRFVRVFAGEPLSGVVAMVALGGGRLLILERSGGQGLPPFESRIYLVDTTKAVDVSKVARGLAERDDLHLSKTLLWKDTLGCNLEGLCMGPLLQGGGRSLVGVADNGGLGTPNQLVVLVMHDEPAAVDASWIGAAAAIAGVALLVLRITSPSPYSTR